MANGDERNGGNRGGDTDDTSDDVAVVLEAVTFPAGRDELARAARDADVDSALIVVIEDLPDDRYETREDAEQAINEKRGSDGGDGDDDSDSAGDRRKAY